MYNDLLISVDELWLKGRNRPVYFQKITSHILRVFKMHHTGKVFTKNDSQRLRVTSNVEIGQVVIDALTMIPGISSISPAILFNRSDDEALDIKKLSELVLKEVSDLFPIQSTFRVSVRRVDKKFQTKSVDLERIVGTEILKNIPNSKVDLKNPKVKIDVRIQLKKISISILNFKGIGGLPWDSSGHALSLLSGGIDSPVASFQMLKRGLKVSYIFFHAYPYVGDEVKEKIKDLVKALAPYQKNCHLYIIPFGDIQNEIAKECKEEYRTIMFRHYMVQVANRAAEIIGADALITGDSLGQVSSQTIGNLTLVDKYSSKLILRPLIGSNKDDVINIAKKIKTFDISIIPHDDACALFAPESPITTPDFQYFKTFVEEHQLTKQIQSSIDNAEVYSVNPKADFFKKDFFSFDS